MTTTAWIKKSNGWLKIVEFVLELVLVLVMIIDQIATGSSHGTYLIIIAAGGYLMITTLFILLYTFDNLQGLTAFGELVSLVVGALLMFISATCVLVFCIDSDSCRAASYVFLAVAIALGIVFTVDAYFAFAKRRKEGKE